MKICRLSIHPDDKRLFREGIDGRHGIAEIEDLRVGLRSAPVVATEWMHRHMADVAAAAIMN